MSESNKQKIPFLVRVSCMTFNHASYIEDAMNGFTMQETTFPFVCTIIDDASTDGEPEVIKKYLLENFDFEDTATVRNEETDDYVMTFARHKTNRNCFFAVFFLKYNHYKKKSKNLYIAEWEDTKYVAYCEGDDYWINPLKLQKQSDYMNSHLDCSATFGNFIVYDQNTCTSHQMVYGKTVFNIHDVMAGLMPGIQNICVRSIVRTVPITSKCNGDMILYYKCGMSGNLIYQNENFAVYRRTGEGSATKRSPKEHLEALFSEEYTFHRELGFNYNADLVRYQIRIIYNHLKKNKYLHDCIRLMKLYHAPSRLRYIQYVTNFIRYIRLDVVRIITGRRKITII